jgi:hypothetical protein
MLAVVRAVEHLFSENISLRAVLVQHGIPEAIWEDEHIALMKDQQTVDVIHKRFQHLYAEIEQSPDLSRALESLVLKIPKSGKVN